jgi:hypothetical protein
VIGIEGDAIPMSAVRPLVVAVKPFPDESLSSVLVRACEANVFTNVSNLLDLIGICATASEAVAFTRSGAAAAIAKLLGTTIEGIESRMHPATNDDIGRSTIQWFGSSIERRHIDARARRFAPHSLEEHGCNSAVWAVRLLDYCPTTMELLHSECPKCSRSLGWRACRSLLRCEKCGTSLLHAKSRTLPFHLHEGARLGAALVSPVAAVRQTAISSLPNPFSTWRPADALVGLLTLGEAQLSLRANDHANTTGAGAQIAAGIEFVSDWPSSLSRYVKESTKRTNSTSVRTALGPLSRLFQSSATRTPIRDLVRSEISTSLGDANVPAKVFSRGAVGSACRSGMLSALEASKELGINLKQLRKLQGQSDTFVTRHDVHGGVALYDKAAISRLREILDESVRPNACARELGIPSYCVEAFVAAGLVDVVTDRDAEIVRGAGLITNASITVLRERFRKRSEKLERGVTLRHCMRRIGVPQHWVAVFEDVLSGRIRSQLIEADDESLTDAVVVDSDDFARRMPRQSSEPDVSGIEISCQVAAKLIGTTPMVVSSAVKAGLMSGELRGRDYAIPLLQVLKFRCEFIVGEEVREIFGGHQRSICSKLDSAGVQSVATINRARVWRRSDIERYVDQIGKSVLKIAQRRRSRKRAAS